MIVRRIDAAASIATRALQVALDHDEKANQAHALRVLGEVHIQSNKAAKSAEYYRSALDLADNLGMRPLSAHCRLGLAQALEQTGDQRAAARQTEAAVAMFGAMDLRLWTERISREKLFAN